ncbi:MAG TPA: WD40 repeat domain-containing serine/threonine protein kinase, partial [Pirellulaceae bacterium]|nr:WD40 repeat domain-containing serine/threonine protein kinase [Pirellulaceae bacterium]
MFTPHDSVRASVAEPNTVGPEAMLREACDDLEERIRRGEAARAEEYLARHPALAADAELALDLIYVEYAARQHRDEPKLREELLARFPHWQAQLQRQFQLDELMDEPSTQCESDDGQTGQLPASEQAGAAARRFRTLGLLAKGGIGQVLRAVDTELNREVAVKELQPAHADNSEVRERFLREAEITGQLEHPGIVPVYGLGSDCQGRPFYAMRLVQGQSFQEAMEEFHRRAGSPRPLLGVEFQKLLRRFLHVCETVAFAHSRGIIHRDLKPANILLGPYGETLVVDWGLAQATGASEQFATSGQRAEAAAADSLTTPAAHWSSALTQISGELIGTPAFMCPEQAAGAAHDVGPAGDVYSLGATLYMLLTGHPPFVGADVSETLNRVSAGRFARPREISRAIPRALEAVCLKAMARRPADRYASPRELADDLEHWLADEPVTAAREWLVARLARWGRRRRSYVVAGSLALVLITVVAVTAAFRIDGERRRADRARGEADRQRSEADRQRIVANRRAAGLAFARGFTLVENEENGVGMLWLSRALQYAPADDAALRRAILTNLSAARQHLVRRRVAFHHPANIWKLAFSPDGATCLTVDRDGTARVWDADSGALKAAHPLGSIALFAVAIRGDGTPLVAVVEGHSLAVKSLPAAPGDSTAADVVLAHPDNLLLAAFSPDGSQICTVTGPPSGPQPASIRIWHTADGQQLTQFAGPTAVESVAFQPQGPAVATLSRDGLVRLWNASDGGRLGNPLQVAGTSVMRMDFTPDGSRLLLGGRDGSLTCWNVGSRRRMFSLPTDRRGEFAGLACASDGQTVVASSADGTARAWHMQDQRTLGDLIHLDRHAGILAFRPGTRQILLAAEPRSAVLWDIPAKTRAAPRLGQGPVQTVAFSPDGSTAATGTRNGIAHLYDAVTGRPLGAAMQHAGTIQHVSFRRDSAVLVTAS